MHSAPRTSVHIQLILAFLVAITVSWVLGSGFANYLAYRESAAIYRHIISQPGIFQRPPPPTFGLREFLLGPGRPPVPQVRPFLGPGAPFPGPPPQAMNPTPQGPPPGASRRSPAAMMLARFGVALLLALVSGTWVYLRFSRPLGDLSKGADAFRSGDFRHRIPAAGDDEFAQVALAMNSMAERVSEQIARLEDDARRRQQFLADVAHELRSPVTTLRTMAGALSEGLADDPERRERAVQSLVNTSDRLLHLVTDLLELAKLDLQELPIHPREVDLRELAGNVLHAHSASAAVHRITLHPIAEGAPIMAMADPDRIAQVLDNLLNNAISYAGEGAQVRIRIEEGASVRMIVEDNGVGIPAKHLPYLFDPFYRADTARTPGDSHSGLGLRIARGLIEAHGGSLILDSVEGKGTRAVITLKRERC